MIAQKLVPGLDPGMVAGFRKKFMLKLKFP
jgi:hypothetical protein